MGASKVKARAMISIGLNQLNQGEELQGLAKCEAGLAMHRATGNTRSGLRSGLFVAEVMHRWGNNARAIAIGLDLLRELRELGGYKLERGYQHCNLAAYHLADGAADRALEALLEAVESVPRDDTFWHWAILQNAAGIEAFAGDPRRAARIMGFVDRRYGAFPDGRQHTEQLQRTRVMERLTAAVPAAELASLMREGESLSAFEADYFANFPVLELGTAP
jgi:hypothetical protein